MRQFILEEMSDPVPTGSVFGNSKSCWSDRIRFHNSDNFEEDYDERRMMISAEREQRDHQAVEKPLPVREEAFIQVARYFIMPLFFPLLSKAGVCMNSEHASGLPKSIFFS